MIVGCQTETRGTIIIDYHAPFDQYFQFMQIKLIGTFCVKQSGTLIRAIMYPDTYIGGREQTSL